MLKRFVTYINQYERGKRGPNVGFVKTDIRDAGCRMEIQLRGLDRFQGKAKVYLIVSGESAIGIPAGELLIHQGIGQLKLAYARGILGASGYSVSQIQAVVIRYGSGQLLASFWTEQVPEGLLQGKFDVWGEAGVEESEPVSEAAESEGESGSQAEAVPEAAAPDAIVPEAESISAPTPDSIGGASDAIASGGKPTAAPTPDVSAPVPEAIQDATLRKSSPNSTNTHGQLQRQEENAANSRTWIPDASGISAQAEPPQNTQPEAQEQVEPPQNTQPEAQEQVEPQKDVQPEAQAAQDIQSEARAQQNTQPEAQAQGEPRPNIQSEVQVQEAAPPQITYKKIAMADIRALPKRNWYLCNNSFLIHGFFNYHYLILKIVECEGQKKCYLGVPGIYEQPERMMAMVFGFPVFEPARIAETDGIAPNTGKTVTGTAGLTADAGITASEADTTGAGMPVSSHEAGVFGYWMLPLMN